MQKILDKMLRTKSGLLNPKMKGNKKFMEKLEPKHMALFSEEADTSATGASD